MKRRSGTIVPYRAAWLLAAVILLAGCTGNGPADNRNSDGISKLAIDNFAIDGQPTLGEPDAPVVVLAFEAPGCTSCRYFHLGEHEGSFTDIQSRYIAPGHLRYVAYQWSIGSTYDQAGGVAAECAYRHGGDAPYFDAINRIFEGQFQSESALLEMLEQLAAAHQLDAGVLESCYESQSTLGDVQADIDYGRQELQAYQSPAFFVVYQDYVHGPIGASRLADAIADGVEATT